MLVDLALARRLERAEGSANARFVEAHARIDPFSGAEWIEVAGAYAMFDGPGSPVTQCFGLGLFYEALEEDLDRLEAFFFDRGADCRLEISPLAGVLLTRRLVERGYVPEEQSDVLYQPLPRIVPEGGNPEVKVRISPAEENALWAEIAQQGWSHSPPEILEYLREIGPIIATRQDSALFLAELEERPIAAAALCLGEGVAVLAGACTIPEARRHGAQRALLDARLDYAAGHGCTVASVVTEPGSSSHRNAERQGFRVAYTRTKWVRVRPSSA